MNKNDDVYLIDILEQINQIEKYVQNISYEIFEDDDMRHDAVLRKLEIIGEASNHISKTFLENHPDFPLKQAIGMRNLLIHAYDDVILDEVWKTIQNDLPDLKLKVNKILQKIEK